MTKLYIANATKQIFCFMYIIPDDDFGNILKAKLPRAQYIQPGQQTAVAGDLTHAQLENIVDQHRAYGLIDVNEIDRTKVFCGQCFSFDKPIPSSRIHQLMTHNLDILDERGRKMRELAAVSVNNGIEQAMQEQRMPGELAKMEMEVTEVRTERSDSEETVPQRIRVTRHGEDGTPAPTRTRARKAA